MLTSTLNFSSKINPSYYLRTLYEKDRFLQAPHGEQHQPSVGRVENQYYILVNQQHFSNL